MNDKIELNCKRTAHIINSIYFQQLSLINEKNDISIEENDYTILIDATPNDNFHIVKYYVEVFDPHNILLCDFNFLNNANSTLEFNIKFYFDVINLSTGQINHIIDVIRGSNTLIKLIRKMAPSIIANSLVGIQPMSINVGDIFSFKTRYTISYESVILNDNE